MLQQCNNYGLERQKIRIRCCKQRESKGQRIDTRNEDPGMYNMGRKGHASHRDAAWKRDKIAEMANEKILRANHKGDSAVAVSIRESDKDVADGNALLIDQEDSTVLPQP
jgi:hypothetical protein